MPDHKCRCKKKTRSSCAQRLINIFYLTDQDRVIYVRVVSVGYLFLPLHYTIQLFFFEKKPNPLSYIFLCPFILFSILSILRGVTPFHSCWFNFHYAAVRRLYLYLSEYPRTFWEGFQDPTCCVGSRKLSYLRTDWYGLVQPDVRSFSLISMYSAERGFVRSIHRATGKARFSGDEPHGIIDKIHFGKFPRSRSSNRFPLTWRALRMFDHHLYKGLVNRGRSVGGHSRFLRCLWGTPLDRIGRAVASTEGGLRSAHWEVPEVS